MVKILLITTVAFRHNGISGVIMNYFRNMDKSDLHIDLVIPEISDDKRLEEFVNAGCGVYAIPRTKKILPYRRQLIQLMKANRYDIVHVHGNSATMAIELEAAKTAGVPVRIAHAHNTETQHPLIHKILLPFLYRYMTAGFACGKDTGHWLFEDRPFTVINGGIQLDKFRYDESIRNRVREELHLSKTDILIGHIGNFIEQKNHRFLIEFAERLIHEYPHIHFLLISDGPLHEEIEEKVESLGIQNNITFIRKTLSPQDYYQSMDLLVLPSLHEGLPVVLTEAQANGLCCFVSNTVTKEANMTGFLKFLPIDDPMIWKDNIITYVSKQHEPREERSEKACREIAEAGYDIVQSAAEEKKLYQKLLKEVKER